MEYKLSIRSNSPVDTVGTDQPKATAARHIDVVLIVGTGQDTTLVEQAERECESGGLSVVTLWGYTASGRGLHERLGPDTHVFFIGHGESTDSGHKVTLAWSQTPTTQELAKLRAPFEDLPAWTGPVHLLACEEGALLDEVKPGTDLWNAGPILLYGGRSKRPTNLPGEDVPASIRFIAQYKQQGLQVNGMQAFAHLANWTGETVSILGGELEGPVTMHAPKVPADMVPGALEAEVLSRQLNQQLDRKARLATASDKDLESLANVVKEQKVGGGAASANPERPAAMILIRAARGKPAQVAALLDERPDLLNQRDRHGRTPLIRACLGKNMPVVELLLQRGAEVNVKDGEERTAISIATFASNIEMKALLLKYGADPTQGGSGSANLIATLNALL